MLNDAYAEARRQAADETEVGADKFSVENPWGMDELLGDAEA